LACSVTGLDEAGLVRDGLAAGPLFLSVVGLLTWAELDDLHRLGWGYTKDNNVPWPSGLALGHIGAIQILNFAVTGLLILVFARAFRHELIASPGGSAPSW
jgi:hypothetical protein